MFSALRQFNKTIWLVIAATFASRFALFMVWPFLAVLLHDRFGLNPFEIGAFLAAATAAGVIFGFYVGYLSDRIGRRKIILAGILLSISAMLILGNAAELIWLFAGTLMQSLARAMIENPGRALMTDMVEDRHVKDMALHMRYFMLNVGAAFGPIVGTFVGLTGQQRTFTLIAGIYAVYLAFAAVIFHIERPLRRTSMATDIRMRDVLRVLGADRAFLIFVAATLIADAAYGQIDAGLVQYLQLANVAELTVLYAQLILVNGATIVLLQFPMLRMTENIAPLYRAMVGVVLFAAGFLSFALVPTSPNFWLWLAMLVLSLGEVILFPTLNIIVDRMAPEHIKGSYFGAAALSQIGFVLAPLVGGFLLNQYGGLALWLTMTTAALIVAWLFFTAERLAAPARAT